MGAICYIEAHMTDSQIPIVILIKAWQDAKLDAYSIRKRVFIEEQGVPEEMELDEEEGNWQDTPIIAQFFSISHPIAPAPTKKVLNCDS